MKLFFLAIFQILCLTGVLLLAHKCMDIFAFALGCFMMAASYAAGVVESNKS